MSYPKAKRVSSKPKAVRHLFPKHWDEDVKEFVEGVHREGRSIKVFLDHPHWNSSHMSTFDSARQRNLPTDVFLANPDWLSRKFWKVLGILGFGYRGDALMKNPDWTLHQLDCFRDALLLGKEKVFETNPGLTENQMDAIAKAIRYDINIDELLAHPEWTGERFYEYVNQAQMDLRTGNVRSSSGN